MTNENPNNIVLKVKDHSVSQKQFDLIQNLKYGCLETFPQPPLNTLSDYYKSEDYISHTDSKRNLFEKVYHVVRRFSLNRKLNLINGFSLNEKKLLDIGCGTGDFLEVAKRNSWTVCGIEPNVQARRIANKKTGDAIFDTDELSELAPSSFDVITLWHVLEHLPNLEEYIQLLKKLLKTNGILVVAVPNYKSYDADYYKEYWAAYDVPRHLWHFNKKSISKLFSEVSMEVVKTKGLYFDAFYVSILSEKYKSGKMSFFNGFLIGLFSNLKSLFSREPSSIIYIIKNQQNSI